jgi:hypothetical protein
MNAQARSPVIVYPTAHHTAIKVTNQEWLVGRNSKKLVASRM